MRPLALALASLLLALVTTPAPVGARPAARPSPAAVRAAFQKLLDRPRVPLDPQLLTSDAGDSGPPGMVTETLSIASEKKAAATVERVPVLIVRPARAARPAAGGDRAARHRRQQGEPARRWLARWRRKGIVGVAIDARYHGDAGPGREGGRAYDARHHDAWRAKPGRAGAPVLLRHRLGPVAHGRLPADPARRRPGPARHDRLQHGRHPDLAGRRRSTSASRSRCRRSPCRASAGAWRTTSGRAGPARSSRRTTPRPRTWASRRSTQGLPGPVGQGHPRHPRPTSTARA